MAEDEVDRRGVEVEDLGESQVARLDPIVVVASCAACLGCLTILLPPAQS